MRHIAYTLLLGMTFVQPLAACSAPLDLELRKQVAVLQRQLELQQDQLVELTAQINDVGTLALCSPELRQLLEDVQKECVPASTSKSGTECFTSQIHGPFMIADPEHRGRFLKFMSHLPHEVLYIPKGSNETSKYRMERLDRLAKPVLLRNTRFLVVSSPESGDGEAARRAQLVEKWLAARKIPPHVIHRWMYAFPAKAADITRQFDLPGLFETRELHRGVWVFRADC